MTTNLKSAEERAAIKELRAREAELAMKDYEAEKLAVQAKTERLRQLRLARDAQSAPAKAAKKSAKKAG